MVKQPLPFVSYNSKEESQVDLIVMRFRQAGINVWYDRHNLLPGSNWREVLTSKIRVAHPVVLFIGNQGYGAIQREELQLALKFRRRIVPVFLPNINYPELPSYLRENVSQFSFLKMTDEGDSFERLCTSIRSYVMRSEMQQDFATILSIVACVSIVVAGQFLSPSLKNSIAEKEVASRAHLGDLRTFDVRSMIQKVIENSRRLGNGNQVDRPSPPHDDAWKNTPMEAEKGFSAEVAPHPRRQRNPPFNIPPDTIMW